MPIHRADPDNADRHFPNYAAEGADDFTAPSLVDPAPNDNGSADSADAPLDTSKLLETLTELLGSPDASGNEVDALLKQCDEPSPGDAYNTSYRRGVAAGVRWMLGDGPHPLTGEPALPPDERD